MNFHSLILNLLSKTQFTLSFSYPLAGPFSLHIVIHLNSDGTEVGYYHMHSIDIFELKNSNYNGISACFRPLLQKKKKKNRNELSFEGLLICVSIVGKKKRSDSQW